MNNLRLLRKMIDVPPKKLAKLLNVTAYTYIAFEQEKMNIPLEIVKMLSMIYQVDEEILLGSEMLQNAELSEKFSRIAKFPEDEKYNLLCKALLGENVKFNYHNIKEVKNKIMDSIYQNRAFYK